MFDCRDESLLGNVLPGVEDRAVLARKRSSELFLTEPRAEVYEGEVGPAVLLKEWCKYSCSLALERHVT